MGDPHPVATRFFERHDAALREQLASLLHRAGALQMVMQLRRHQPVPTVSIITYHHLGEHEPRYAYDPEIIDATPSITWQRPSSRFPSDITCETVFPSRMNSSNCVAMRATAS